MIHHRLVVTAASGESSCALKQRTAAASAEEWRKNPNSRSEIETQGQHRT